jgi:hypothetical protein
VYLNLVHDHVLLMYIVNCMFISWIHQLFVLTH